MPDRCPACGSRQPSMHPAVGGGGEVTSICQNPFHGGRPEKGDAVRNFRDELRPHARRLAFWEMRGLGRFLVALGSLVGKDTAGVRDWLARLDKDPGVPTMQLEKGAALAIVIAARAEAPGQTGDPVEGSRYGLVYNWPQGCRECLDRLRVMFACSACGEITCVDCECRCYRDGDL